MAENALTRGLYQAKIGPTPRNALLGGIADALRYVDEGANVPDPTNPAQKGRKVLSFLSNALGIGDLAAVADRASYGLPQTQGTGFARQMLPETRNALAGAFPAAIAKPQTAARMAMSALTNGLDGGAQRAMFIGPAARTWDSAAAAKAEELAARGVDPRAIWKQTGTFKGADGKWRQEIDDSGARWEPWFEASPPGQAINTAVGDALDHAELFRAYPQSPNIGLGMYPSAHNAAFQPGANKAFIPNRGESGKSMLLHELQHAIQGKESMNSGGAFKDFAGLEDYMRLAGEAEARAVQSRMNMTPRQRRAVFPFDSYDIPAERLIVR